MILVKSADEIAKMERACQIVAHTLAKLKAMVGPGITTMDMERMAEESIAASGGKPAFKGYRGYPACICASVNSEVIHGIPSARTRLKEGDIVGIDLGVSYEGFYGDAALTVAVGRVSSDASRLMEATSKALELAIAEASVGNRVSDIGYAVQRHVEELGYSVVRSFVGHGIGKSLHEEPQVPNYGPPGRGPRLKPGMTLAIEPMVNAGASDVRVLDDGWTAVTVDGSLSAHYEHTVVVTEKGGRVLTLPR